MITCLITCSLGKCLRSCEHELNVSNYEGRSAFLWCFTSVARLPSLQLCPCKNVMSAVPSLSIQLPEKEHHLHHHRHLA